MVMNYSQAIINGNESFNSLSNLIVRAIKSDLKQILNSITLDLSQNISFPSEAIYRHDYYQNIKNIVN